MFSPGSRVIVKARPEGEQGVEMGQSFVAYPAGVLLYNYPMCRFHRPHDLVLRSRITTLNKALPFHTEQETPPYCLGLICFYDMTAGSIMTRTWSIRSSQSHQKAIGRPSAGHGVMTGHVGEAVAARRNYVNTFGAR